jgi:transcription initiation factor IIE alpha subunit
MSEIVNFPESEYDNIECCACKFSFDVPASFKRQRREDHRPFYCPKCGTSMSYLEPEVEKLRKRVADLEAARRETRRLSISERLRGRTSESSKE